MADKKKFSFSEKMARLEKIAADLENSEIDLDEAIKRFEEGARLASELKDYLEKSKNQIETVKKRFDK
ncbi:MAG: exodeoxyribonuclease VII small subunit [bacterium]|nr:exodeoxyribonuclease VII small subunit [bacterium]